MAGEGRPVNQVPGRWTRRQRDIGVVIWVSFLAASVGTLIIFALVDPRAVTDSWSLKWEISSKLGYSLGFAFLWVVCFLASALTAFMMRTGPRRGHARGRDDKIVPMTRDPEVNNPDLKDQDW